jgi:hypothetical protein
MRYVGDRIRPFSMDKDRAAYLVPIPTYHRAAVGIFPGTKLYATPVPSRNEMVVTSISPDNWGDIWRIDLNLKDLPGAVESVIRTLHKHKVNILVEESMSHVAGNRQKAHALLLVVDLFRYENEFDGDTETRKSLQKQTYNPCFLMNDLISNSKAFLHKTRGDGAWDAEISRLQYFFGIQENREEYQTTYLHEGKISLTRDEVLDRFYGGDQTKTPMGFITSDTEEKCLKINFVNEARRYIMLEIYHKEEHGAILQVMEKIRAQRINIIASYTRLFQMDRVSVWYGILEFPLDMGDDDLKKLIKAIDALPMVSERFSIIDHYNWDLDFGTLGDRWALEHLKPKVVRSPATRPVPPAKTERAKKVPDNLQTRPYYEGQGWNHEDKSVFVAITFNDTGDNMYKNVYYDVVNSKDLVPCRVDQVHSPNDDAIINLIKRKIATCEFMIADVSDQNPNVMYEVALGHAIGKQVILCSERRDGTQSPLAFDIRERAHLFYDASTMDKFRRNLAAKIEAIVTRQDVLASFP